MLTVLINLYCLKAYHRPDHSIRIIEYHRKKIFIPKTNIFTETRTQDSFRVCDLSSCYLLAETNNFVFWTILLLHVVSRIEEPPSPGFEPRTLSRSFYLFKISSWFQGISMSSLVQIGLSVLEV
jgi:hypothetical protein